MSNLFLRNWCGFWALFAMVLFGTFLYYGDTSDSLLSLLLAVLEGYGCSYYQYQHELEMIEEEDV